MLLTVLSKYWKPVLPWLLALVLSAVCTVLYGNHRYSVGVKEGAKSVQEQFDAYVAKQEEIKAVAVLNQREASKQAQIVYRGEVKNEETKTRVIYKDVIRYVSSDSSCLDADGLRIVNEAIASDTSGH